MTWVLRCLAIAVLAGLLSGCVGIVGGELADVDQTAVDLTYCDTQQREWPYEIAVETDAHYDYGSDNIAGLVSTWTFGVVPTYWLSFVHAQGTLYQQGQPLARYEYGARIHKFYGILWPFVLSPVLSFVDDANEIPADEGVGMRVPSVIQRKAAVQTQRRVVDERGIDPADLCHRRPNVADV